MRMLIEILTIVVVMLLNLYPVMELTRVIEIYTRTWRDFDSVFQTELIFFVWLPYFLTPIFLAGMLFLLSKLRRE